MDRVEDWFHALKNPRSVVREALRLPSRREKVRAARSLWFAALFLSILVSLPLHYTYGLKIENMSFQVTSLAMQYGIIAVVARMIHGGFRRFEIESRTSDTFVLTVVVWSAIMPLYTVFRLHEERQMLDHIRSLKARGMSLGAALLTLFEERDDTGPQLEAIFSAVADPALMLIGLWVIATLIRLSAEHYRATIPQTARAVSFGVVVLGLPTAVVLALAPFILYYAFVT